MKSVAEDKSRLFALRIVKLYKYLKSKREDVMSKQVLRSGTSIGANIAEGKYAQSTEEFISKMSIALKEASETYYWLGLLFDSDYIPDTENTKSLFADCDELIRILVSSVKTAKSLRRFTDVKKWHDGYIEVMADYGARVEEDYIDLVPILENLYIPAHDYVRPIKKVVLNYV